MTQPELWDDLPKIPKRGKHYVEPKGYAQPPGFGPDGETCGSCEHVVRMKQCKSWAKCGLARENWTHGRATDVLVGSPACGKWQIREEDINRDVKTPERPRLRCHSCGSFRHCRGKSRYTGHEVCWCTSCERKRRGPDEKQARQDSLRTRTRRMRRLR